jgi:hypothetical protein
VEQIGNDENDQKRRDQTLEAHQEKCNNPNHHQAYEQLGVGTPTWGCI